MPLTFVLYSAPDQNPIDGVFGAKLEFKLRICSERLELLHKRQIAKKGGDR